MSHEEVSYCRLERVCVHLETYLVPRESVKVVDCVVESFVVWKVVQTSS